MQLFVGLGNPGAKHVGNRHNIGFMAVDRIADEHGRPAWRSRHQGLIAEALIDGAKVALLKPQGYMNLSGQTVGEAMRYLKLTPAEVTVFHDELDLAPGKCRVKQGGGHAGHNGLRSITEHIGPDFRRVRLGIGHPGDRDRVSAYVLSDFGKADAGWLGLLLDGVAEAAPALAGGDAAAFQNRIALRLRPARGPARTSPAKAGAAPNIPVADRPAPAETAGGATDPKAKPRGALQRLIDRLR